MSIDIWGGLSGQFGMVATMVEIAQTADWPQSNLQTVDRAIYLMKVVGSVPDGVSIRDAAAMLGLNLTTTYRLANALIEHEYLVRRDNGDLQLGRGIVNLYRDYRRGVPVQAEALDIVRGLRDATKETAFLSILEEDSVVLSTFLEGRDPVRASGLFVGRRGDEHIRAAGKAILAFSDQNTRDRVMARSLRDLTEAARSAAVERLEIELPRVRELGWAVDDDGLKEDIVGVAVPFFNGEGRCVGAVGVWLPHSRWHGRKEMLLEAAAVAASAATAAAIQD